MSDLPDEQRERTGAVRLTEDMVERLIKQREDLQAQADALTAIIEGRTRAVSYPNVVVRLTEEDGNAWSIMARVTRAMKEAGIDSIERDAYREQAMSGDYNHLLRVTMEWVHTY